MHTHADTHTKKKSLPNTPKDAPLLVLRENVIAGEVVQQVGNLRLRPVLAFLHRQALIQGLPQRRDGFFPVVLGGRGWGNDDLRKEGNDGCYWWYLKRVFFFILFLFSLSPFPSHEENFIKLHVMNP